MKQVNAIKMSTDVERNPRKCFHDYLIISQLYTSEVREQEKECKL